MTQSEQLGDDTSPAANAMRDRIREQFTDRYNEHAAVKAELDALTAETAPAVNDPALLDELPYAPGLLADAPDAIREALYAAFDIQCLYRHDVGQVTIWATITDTTPGIIAALTADPRTDSDTGNQHTSTRPVCRLASCRYNARNCRQILIPLRIRRSQLVTPRPRDQ